MARRSRGPVPPGKDEDARPATPGMKQRLIWYGMVLFSLGIVTELLMRFLLNPRMAYSAHLVALMSGIFLTQLGVVWDEMDIPPAWAPVAFWVWVFATYTAWGSMFVAAIFGTSRSTPLASMDMRRAAMLWQENLVDGIYVAFFIAIVLSCALVLWGLARKRALVRA
jgi:hydroxylaminobenzene mutase